MAKGELQGDMIKDNEKLARETVEALLEITKTSAKDCGKDVSGPAYDWWRTHYIHSFFFALVFKGKTEAQLKHEKTVAAHTALAQVLGRAAAIIADDAGKTAIAVDHAAKASQIVDCPALGVRDIVAEAFADWCN